jgi:hypothetical protein
MPRFNLHDLHSLDTPSSPGSLRARVGEIIIDSTTCRAKVESVNPETGEYRVVLQGTLDTSNASSKKWDSA